LEFSFFCVSVPQVALDLPADSLEQSLSREQALHRIHTDFTRAAVQAARDVVDGNIPPINPMDVPRNYMYYPGNILLVECLEEQDELVSPLSASVRLPRSYCVSPLLFPSFQLSFASF